MLLVFFIHIISPVENENGGKGRDTCNQHPLQTLLCIMPKPVYLLSASVNNKEVSSLKNKTLNIQYSYLIREYKLISAVLLLLVCNKTMFVCISHNLILNSNYDSNKKFKVNEMECNVPVIVN